jgi:hypothetical protein
MDIGEAIRALKTTRHAIRRHDLADIIVLVPGSTVTVDRDRPLGKALPRNVGTPVFYQPHLDVVNARREVRPWTPTSADLLAEDWELVDPYPGERYPGPEYAPGTLGPPPPPGG